ncbi:hypothetical protein K353_00366 [Kitasatospora sp. SolWspMP-SS2h]|uniref:hypothetical protein n=1 Tax=Kitasatospora sp. SolWspMP-SS2h TaxID=1305729 RepID=UPI000DB907A4|nr:hypothetical protein [Kitasatospora sp. SolWspMP-SS2h]RAJ47165.1 hypothetical protein K353_00366 [Kitasatospora sp. SolWspMP-SS2h]
MYTTRDPIRQQWRTDAQDAGRNPLDDYDPETNRRVGAGRPVGWGTCRCPLPKCPHRPEPAA